MAIKKSEEHNRKRRQALSVRLALMLSVVSIVALGVLSVVLFDVRVPSVAALFKSEVEYQSDNDAEPLPDLEVQPAEQEPGRTVFVSNFPDDVGSLSFVLTVGGQSGVEGLVSLDVISDDRRFSGELHSGDAIFDVSGRSTPIFLSLTPGTHRLVLLRTSDDAAQVALTADHP